MGRKKVFINVLFVLLLENSYRNDEYEGERAYSSAFIASLISSALTDFLPEYPAFLTAFLAIIKTYSSVNACRK